MSPRALRITIATGVLGACAAIAGTIALVLYRLGHIGRIA